jgi:nicotinate dehydrogenase subunit A
MARITLTVNDRERALDVRDPGEPLLFVLRNQLGLTGAKYGCGVGQCGACTVLVDGEAVRSCLVPAGSAAGRAVTTVEHLGTAERPGPLQRAFVEQQAAQCGYCVPGMVMSAAALLRRNPRPTGDEVKRALDGNLCRCGTHQRIIDAVLLAAGTR